MEAGRKFRTGVNVYLLNMNVDIGHAEKAAKVTRLFP
jgi:hypothetical protein